MKSDTEIADSTVLEEIDTIARKAGIPVENLFHYGPYIAKVPLKLIDDHKAKKSHLILVTAITATKAGVGKTTVSIGLGMDSTISVRKPSSLYESLRWVHVSGLRAELPAAGTHKYYLPKESICTSPEISMPLRRLTT